MGIDLTIQLTVIIYSIFVDLLILASILDVYTVEWEGVMLLETIERVNRLRQQALNDPEFIQSAKAHEKALNDQSHYDLAVKRKSSKGRKDRSLAQIYHHAEFGQRSDSSTH